MSENTNENVTYVFSSSTLKKALNDWKKEQIQQFPHRKDLIELTCISIAYFMRSQHVIDGKMVMSGEPENFQIEMPESIDIESILGSLNK